MFEWWYKKYAKEIYNKGYIEGYLLGHKDGKAKGEVEGYRRGILEAKDGGVHISKYGLSVFKNGEIQ